MGREACTSSQSYTEPESSMERLAGLNGHIEEGENKSSDLKCCTRSSGVLKNICVLDILGFPQHHLPLGPKQDWKLMRNKMQTNHWISCRKSLEILGLPHCG